ncbi:MAG: cupin domain-containing protein [Acidobacteriaceae bacterium]
MADSFHPSRRRFLEFGSAALAAGALGGAAESQTKEQVEQAEHGPSSSLILGQDNPALHAENPDSVTPPATDHGNPGSFKYPFSFAHKRVQPGGWTRQVTMADLHVSKEIAGVQMRLVAGGIRELHWHNASEWALMLAGGARITCIDPDGRSFVDDVKEGDIWNFPSGYPHSIQGLPPDGCEFLLVFDDGNFDEYETVLLTDWMVHTPPEVLAKNFGVPATAFPPLPPEGRYIFPGTIPGPLEADRKAAYGNLGPSRLPFDFRLIEMPPTHSAKGGEVRIVDSNNFKASLQIAAAHVILHPGGLREMHWHPNADEWQYYVKGKGRMTVFAAAGRARTMDFQQGDVGYVPRNFPHYIENTGDTDLVFLEMFKDSYYQDVSLANWLTHLPPQLVVDHLKIGRETLDAFPHEEKVVRP